jgi:hypothetical protein
MSKGEGTGEGNDKFGLTKYLYSYFEVFFKTDGSLTTWD